LKQWRYSDPEQRRHKRSITPCFQYNDFSIFNYSGYHDPGHGEESPLDILKKRYVKGEISKEEYDKMKKDIS